MIIIDTIVKYNSFISGFLVSVILIFLLYNMISFIINLYYDDEENNKKISINIIIILVIIFIVSILWIISFFNRVQVKKIQLYNRSNNDIKTFKYINNIELRDRKSSSNAASMNTNSNISSTNNNINMGDNTSSNESQNCISLFN